MRHATITLTMRGVVSPLSGSMTAEPNFWQHNSSCPPLAFPPPSISTPEPHAVLCLPLERRFLHAGVGSPLSGSMTARAGPTSGSSTARGTPRGLRTEPTAFGYGHSSPSNGSLTARSRLTPPSGSMTARGKH